jgi:uncharacterized membrane protein YphA (DoxX/SURF4 family)
MRLTWGHQLFMTGLADLKNIDALTATLKNFNFPTPVFHSYEFAYVELIGGVLLFMGFLSRLAAIPVAIVMIAILSTVHGEAIGNFRFITDPVLLTVQRPYPFLITALLVFTFGPGRVSIDAWIKRWVERQFRY